MQRLIRDLPHTLPPPIIDSVEALPHNVSSDTVKDEKGQIDSISRSSSKEGLVI